jgi:glucosyl-3-phosphoglycerate synthase
MSDFYQERNITTLHILGDRGLAKIEAELEEIGKTERTTVVIPALHSDFVRPAMQGILDVYRDIRFVNRIILALGGATAREMREARASLRDHPLPFTVLWMDNPGLRRLLAKLETGGLWLGPDGKGKSCWASFGLALALDEAKTLALHDSDIKTFNKEMLARLIYPVANPNLTFLFSKGFYARYTRKLHGRVTRLFVLPLFKSVENIIGAHPFIHYLNSFRYPLAGEFALDIDLTRVIRFPGDWGLEVTTLYEIYRNIATKRVCQVEIAENYDHKHQSLSAKDSGAGLHKMVLDISTNVLKNLAAEGVVLNFGLLKTIQKNYLKTAEDLIANYHAEAMINDFEFDRHDEESYVEIFFKAFAAASERFLKEPIGPRMLPNWNRITAANPGFLTELRDLVADDNA